MPSSSSVLTSSPVRSRVPSWSETTGRRGSANGSLPSTSSSALRRSAPNATECSGGRIVYSDMPPRARIRPLNHSRAASRSDTMWKSSSM